MKASFHTKYGPPEVLQIVEVNKPIPKDDEVLIKIHATTVNRTDCGFRQPEYFFVRFFSGVFKPKINILGTEFAGTVEAIGKNVTLFKVGDSVFGLNTFKFGTHAEYVCIPEHRSIALKPENMSFEEAAAICDGLMLAINYIRKIDFKSTPKILINGASGSIGSAAVQLAKYYGAEITAVCRAEHFELIRSLGANKLIDYTKEDFTKTDDTYDTVLDAVGKSSFGKCKNILKPNGVYYSTELGDWAQNVFLPLFNSFRNKKVKFPIPTDNKKDILFFKELIEGGNFRAIIDRKYPLEKIVEATKYVESGEKVGNVVITIF
ncbi:MAG: NAD(P)-dependent alcohol dehydrogenase [Bacteroidetes bacterium]|nr:NAD(P)-dependent alcohol dehydrogenase [Bacteroidota bacterium]